jgi:hypothetical protein
VFSFDPVHFAAEQIERDGTGVVGLKQFLSFVSESGDDSFLTGFLVGCCVSFGVELFEDNVSEFVVLVRGELDSGVAVFDGLNGFVDRDRSLGTALGVALSSEANEVGVDPTVVAPLV